MTRSGLRPPGVALTQASNMNIQQIMTEGQGLVLNDIEIQDDYGAKPGKTPHRAMLITDSAGGKTILKIWGPGSAQTFHKGEKISIQGMGEQGAIKANEYPTGSGKFTLNANSCEIVRGEVTDQSPPPVAQEPAAAPQRPSSGFQRQFLTADELADAQAAHFARMCQRLKGVGEELGADSSDILRAAALMTGSASDWWFGAKWPDMPQANR